MCAYKLVTVKFKWWGLQNKVENFIQKVSVWKMYIMGFIKVNMKFKMNNIFSKDFYPPYFFALSDSSCIYFLSQKPHKI